MERNIESLRILGNGEVYGMEKKTEALRVQGLAK